MISVIMLTYNREQYVKGMIENILQQTYRNFEFIIIDNGSTDKSGQIADFYAEKDDRIRVIHLKSSCSIGKGRNIGVQHSKGEFIAFVDDDDKVEKDYLEFLYCLQKEFNSDISVCGCDEFEDGTIRPQCAFKEKYSLSGKESVVLLLKRTLIRSGMPTKLFKRELLKTFPFNEDCISEDIHTAYLYFSNAVTVALHGIVKYHIRRHNNNNSLFTSNFKKMTPELLKEYLNIYEKRSEYLSQKYPIEKEFFQYCVWSFKVSMCMKISKAGSLQYTRQFEKMVQELSDNREIIESCRYLTSEEKKNLNKLLGKV